MKTIARRLSSRLRIAAAACLLPLATSLWAIDVQGHRGARGLAPENTLAAFERALEVGVDTLELDIGITADGVAVVAHDPFINPVLARDAAGQWVSGQDLPIRQLTLAQVQAYDVGRIAPGTPYAATFATQLPRDGERMPTLAALFEKVRQRGDDGVRFNIELKTNPQKPGQTASPEVFVQTVLKDIRAAGMESRVTLQSFDWRNLQLAQQAAPGIPTAYLTMQSANVDNTRDPAWTAGHLLRNHAGSVPQMVKAAGGAVWAPNAPALSQPLVKEAQALGLSVIPWTVNDPAEMRRLIGWGVNGIITDYPDRLQAVLRESRR